MAEVISTTIDTLASCTITYHQCDNKK